MIAKGKPLDDILNKYYGEAGTPERDAFEAKYMESLREQDKEVVRMSPAMLKEFDKAMQEAVKEWNASDEPR